MTRYGRFGDFEGMQRRMEKLFDNVFDDMRFSQQEWQPAIDIYETPDEVIVLVEMAGVNKDDIKVEMEKDILRIHGTRPDWSPIGKLKLHQMEIDYGRFLRIIRITLPIEDEGISAKYNDGVLRITLPKRSKNRAVDVEVVQE
jgi:HSP20 family protein